MTKKELLRLKISPPDWKTAKQVKENWDRVAKPLDSLGEFEGITAKIGSILGTADLNIEKKAVIVMCADNGIVEEGISQSGQDVTAAVCKALGRKESSVGKLAALAGADVFPVDIGISQSAEIPGVLNKKIRKGTRNFRREPAMTKEELLSAIQVGMDLVHTLKKDGYRIIATGEMGIGNTTTSSAVAAALTGFRAEMMTGRGAGLTGEGLNRKRQVIQEAIDAYSLYEAEPFLVLQTVGGLDIAGLAGVFIGGALYHIPIVMDGMISAAAVLSAQRLVPGVRDFVIASHKSREPAMGILLDELLAKPVLDADLALGEGTGAVLMLGLLNLVLALYENKTTFEDICIAPYERF